MLMLMLTSCAKPVSARTGRCRPRVLILTYRLSTAPTAGCLSRTSSPAPQLRVNQARGRPAAQAELARRQGDVAVPARVPVTAARLGAGDLAVC